MNDDVCDKSAKAFDSSSSKFYFQKNTTFEQYQEKENTS